MTFRQYRDYKYDRLMGNMAVLLFLLSLPMMLKAASIAEEHAVCGFRSVTGFKNNYTENLCDPEFRRQRTKEVFDAVTKGLSDLQESVEQDLENIRKAAAMRKQQRGAKAVKASKGFTPWPKTGTIATCSARPTQGTGVDPTVAE
jgi:hypothetical protein